MKRGHTLHPLAFPYARWGAPVRREGGHLGTTATPAIGNTWAVKSGDVDGQATDMPPVTFTGTRSFVPWKGQTILEWASPDLDRGFSRLEHQVRDQRVAG